MKNQKGVSMITLIITIIVIIILAAIAFVGMDDATGSAQFSGFASEFGDYATNFQNGPYSNVTEAFGLAGKAANKTQKYYAAARGITLSDFDGILNGVTTPAGYQFKETVLKHGATTNVKFIVKDATGAEYAGEDFTLFYQIKDGVMKEYPETKNFYGDANGEETHWVTDTGLVFTLPGFPREVDGEERMYITASLYYNPTDAGEMLTATSDCLQVNFGVRNDSVLAKTEGNEVAKTVQKAADATDVMALQGIADANKQTTKTPTETPTETD